MKFIEILGFPGSGKSTFREKINKKELIFSLEYIFYQTLFSENKNISLLHYKFLYYLDKKKFYDIAFDNYLYKKNNLANIIKKKINHSNNDFYKNNINLYNNYKKLYEKDKSSFNNQYVGKVAKRSLFLLLAGVTMTVLSYLGFGNLFVKFGIFHFIGVALLLAIPIVHSKFLSLAVTLLIGIVHVLSKTARLQAFFSTQCQNIPFICFVSGVYNIKFSSLDHFSIIPYFALVTFGIFLGHLLYTDRKRKFLNEKENEKFENYEKKNVVNNIGLMGKNSFIIYFFHFVLFYIMLIGYKYQLKPKIDNFIDTNSVTEKMDILEGDNLMENTNKSD